MRENQFTKKWRTLIRVLSVGPQHCYMIIPGWNSQVSVPVRIDRLPLKVQKALKPGNRMHAMVNIGAYNSTELSFSDWEV